MMGSNKVLSRMILFLLLTNAFLFPQAHAMDDDTDSQTTPETSHHWTFDDKKNTSSEYGEDINGQNYNQDGTVSGSSASQSDSPTATDSGAALHKWTFDDKKNTSSAYGVDINGQSYNQDGTVSNSPAS